jgi:hypothetical protein
MQIGWCAPLAKGALLADLGYDYIETTLARLLGDALGAPSLDLDEIRAKYYREIGYDHGHAEKLRDQGRMQAMFAYWKPFEIYSVERMFQDCPSGYERLSWHK